MEEMCNRVDVSSVVVEESAVAEKLCEMDSGKTRKADCAPPVLTMPVQESASEMKTY